jgi:transketolase
MRDAFVRALSELAAEDPSVVLVTGDLGFGVLADYSRRFPDQFVNAGVAEQNMTALACGMALEGARAYTYSIANFPTLRCLEQLRNDVCYHGAAVTVVAVGGGFSYGPLGMSHFATEDLAIMRAIPGMTVVAPSDPWMAYELARQLYRTGAPAYLRIDKGQAGLPSGHVELGKVRTVREGGDGVIFAIGGILAEALAAADALRDEGLAVAVVDIHTLKPLDTAGVRAAAEGQPVVVTLEEHTVIGGLGSAVGEALLEGGIAPRMFRRIGLADCFPEVVGDQAYLRAAFGLDRHAVVAAFREALAPC